MPIYPDPAPFGTTLTDPDHWTKMHRLMNSTVNSQSGTSYTLVSSDLFKIIELTSSSAVTVTIPTGLPEGAVVSIVRIGTGAVTLVAGSGMTLQSPGGALGLRLQYSSATIRYRSTTSAIVAGDLI